MGISSGLQLETATWQAELSQMNFEISCQASHSTSHLFMCTFVCVRSHILLGMDPMTCHMLDKYSTTELHSRSLLSYLRCIF